MAAEGGKPLVSAGWKRQNLFLGATKNELYAEMFGTFVLILGGTAVVATSRHRLKDQEVSLGLVTGDTFSEGMYINLGWALSVGAGVLVSFDASGAHLNPAVTLTSMIHDDFGVGKGLAYMLFQCIGALLGAVLTGFLFTGFGDQLETYGSAFYHTGPSPGTPFWNAFFVEVVATAVLLVCISFVANGDPKPNKLIMAGALVAFIFFIGTTIGYQTGYSLNPARDAMPRLVRLVQELTFGGKGWTSETVQGIVDWKAWVPAIISPLIGGPLGKALWKIFSQPEESTAEEVVEMS